MAIALEVNDILRIRLATFLEGQMGLNVLHYRISSISGGATLIDDVPAGFYDFVQERYCDLFATQTEFSGVGASIVLPGDRRTIEYRSAGNTGVLLGTNGDETLPKQVTAVIRFRRERAGRMARGRNYIPFPAQTGADFTTGLPNAGYIVKLTDYLNTISPTCTVPIKTHTIVITHGILGKLSGFDPVAAVAVSRRWATQRRRGDYGAQNTNFLA